MVSQQSISRPSVQECNATYNAISVHPTWEEQVEYLKKEKIAKYKNHYHARYDGGKVVEMYKLKGDDVLKLLLPKLKRAYDRMSDGQVEKGSTSRRYNYQCQRFVSMGRKYHANDIWKYSS